MLEIKNLSLDFNRYTGFFKKNKLKIISNFNLYVNRGEIVAIIGSSGSGKSLLAHSILGILPKNAVVGGEIIFKNERLTPNKQKLLRGREIALIPQSINFLDPLKSVGGHIKRCTHFYTGNNLKAQKLTDEAFARYNLGSEVKKYFPFQISGGMARRVLTAMATVTGADLIIADEPTTGLDGNAIDESLSYLREIANSGKSVILITHDIKYALKYSDRIAVFYGGTTVEIASPSDFTDINKLRHPFTKELYKSMPQNDFSFISGLNPFGIMLDKGCVFQPRCSLCSESCKNIQPKKKIINDGQVWCHNA